jgi:hypothetical protein
VCTCPMPSSVGTSIQDAYEMAIPNMSPALDQTVRIPETIDHVVAIADLTKGSCGLRGN